MGKVLSICKRVLLGILIAALPVPTVLAQSAPSAVLAMEPDFAEWLSGVRAEALARGIGPDTLDAALTGLAPIDRVLELDRRQPEFTQSFWSYLDRAISDTRVARGKALLDEHATLLAEMEARYGVPGRFLVSFWGLETNFGGNLGGFPVIGALATLAHDPRRSEFFRAELLHALSILEAHDVDPANMVGSWAGAMGQPQFMPSTFVRHAVDGDGDGRRDIWGTLPDVFASAGNFLRDLGWQPEYTWGREVRLPPGFDVERADLNLRLSLSEWQALGVRKADGGSLPAVDIPASLVLPAGYAGPAFLVYQNFRVILGWNRSILYAIAVGHLADRIAGAGPFLAARPAGEERLSRDQVMAMQDGLNRLGYDTGTPDGIVGAMTRDALRAFQRANGLPPDGYPTLGVVTRILSAAGG